MTDEQKPQDDRQERIQEELDHHANQHNPNNEAHRDRMNNHSEQLNPNNPKYHESRRDD